MPKTPWADRYRAAPTNKSNVMRTIILEGPISRAALAKRVGLSLPSVMTITENLINRGLVRAVGKGKSSGGKPPELLSVVPESEYYMGVDIGPWDHTTGADEFGAEGSIRNHGGNGGGPAC